MRRGSVARAAGTLSLLIAASACRSETAKPSTISASAGTVELQARAMPRADSAPAVVRALYVNRFAAQSKKRMTAMIAIADSTEINAFVMDMKDEFGLNFKTENKEWAKNAGKAGTVPHLEELLDTLKAHKILPIARIVVFKDSVTARVHPDWTIRTPDGAVWRDKTKLAWVNPYHKELWDYNIGIAEELVKLGFGEIQFDYIRFPEPYASLPKQVFPGDSGIAKPQLLADYLKRAKQRLNALGVRSTADVFGFVPTVHGALEVGQDWVKISPVVDVVLPMVYPSHFPAGSLGIAHPNADPYKIIKISIDTARVRDAKMGVTMPEHVRPWLQAFTLGKPEYGAEQLKQEKQAVYDAGYDGWVLWNPGSKYDVYLPALDKTLVSHKKQY